MGWWLKSYKNDWLEFASRAEWFFLEIARENFGVANLSGKYDLRDQAREYIRAWFEGSASGHLHHAKFEKIDSRRSKKSKGHCPFEGGTGFVSEIDENDNVIRKFDGISAFAFVYDQKGNTITEYLGINPFWIFDPCIAFRFWLAWLTADDEFFRLVGKGFNNYAKKTSKRKGTPKGSYVRILRAFVFMLHHLREIDLKSGDPHEVDRAFIYATCLADEEPKLFRGSDGKAKERTVNYLRDRKKFMAACQNWAKVL